MTSATLDNMIASLDHEDTVAVEKVSGVIEGMKLMGASENDIINKVMETYNVTKEYVLALLAPKTA